MRRIPFNYYKKIILGKFLMIPLNSSGKCERNARGIWPIYEIGLDVGAQFIAPVSLVGSGSTRQMKFD